MMSNGPMYAEPSRTEKDIVDRWMGVHFPERTPGDYTMRPEWRETGGAVIYRADLRNRFGDCYRLEIAFDQFYHAGGATALVRRLNEIDAGPRMRRLPNGNWAYQRGELRRLRSSTEQPAAET
jgi:hypothetical protein